LTGDNTAITTSISPFNFTILPGPPNGWYAWQ
jgi:hypothetical protein